MDVISNNIDLVCSFFSAEYGEENDDDEERGHCKLCTLYNARLRTFPSIPLHGRAGWLSRSTILALPSVDFGQSPCDRQW